MSTPTRPESPAPQGAIVTGGARGIGLGIARELAGRGYRVVLWDRDFSSFNQDRAGFKPAALTRVDVTDLGAVERAFAEALAAAGPIDILVNNAGINGPVAKTWEYPVEAWHEVLAVDLTSVFYCSRAAVTHMRARGYGRIVNIASMAGKEGNQELCAYAAAKAGVIGFTKSLARELTDTNVLVNAVAPALTETELFQQMTPEHIARAKARIPMGRTVQVSEVAALVGWITSPECSFTTGFVFDISGGRATY
jgi:3-oxoacyl-[acyl-carrier protein] reductase